MPEENIKTTLQFQADITDFKAAMQEANRAIKLANSEFKAASSGMDDWSNSTDGLSAKLQQLSTVQEAEQRKLDALKASYAQVVKEQGANSAAAQELQVKINNQQAVVNKAAREYNTFADKLDEVENSAGDAADDIKKAGDAAEDSGKSAEEGAGGWTIIKDVIADFVKNTISWAVDSFKELMTAGDNALATLGARTGATADQMSKYKSVMDDIYRNNYGESFDDVADAMGVVIQTFGDLDNTSLQNITQNAIALRDTFGFDYQETIRAVNSMMKQFGITADEAYNLIAQGAQNGLNQNDDLLDTINEYSVQFSTAGYSADDMFNMLKNGAESGTWSVDKLGDAVKEFGIRAKDGSESTANAFAMLGYSVGDSSKAIADTKDEISKLEKNLKYAKMEQEGFNEKTSELTRMKNADKIAEYEAALKTAKDTLAGLQNESKNTGKSFEDWEAQFAAGGESAKAATAEMLEALLAIEDPVKQNAVGVALFGTMWEDLGPKAVASLLQTEGEISRTKTAMDDLANTKYDTLSSALTGLGRVIQTDLLQPVADTLAPIVKGLVEWLIENMPTLQPIIIGVATAIGILAAALAIQGLINGVSKAFALLNATILANPIVLIVALIAGLVAAFVALWNKSEEFRAFWQNLWQAVSNAVQTAWQGITNFFTKTIPELISKIINWFKELPGKIGTAIAGAVNTVKTWGSNVLNTFKTSITNTITNIVNWFKALPGKIGTAIANAINTVKTWGSNVFNTFKTSITDTIANIVNWFKELPGKIWDAIVGAVQSVGRWGSDLLAKGKEAASNLVSSVVDGVKSLPGKLLDVGKNLVSGLWDGISNSFQWIKNKISGWVGNVMDFIKGLFGIHSPSAVMRDEVGKMLGLGMADGIDKSKKNVQSAMRGLRGAVTDDPVNGGGQAGVGLPGGRTVIINQTNNSPRALSRREIYRQTHNALAAAGGV